MTSSLRNRSQFRREESQPPCAGRYRASNLIRIRDFKMGRQVRHSALTLVAEPGRRCYLLPDFTDNGFIDLDPVFQGIERVLQLFDELVGQVWPSRRKT